MTTVINPSLEAQRAIVEAARWRLTGLLLERPQCGWLDEVQALAAEVEDKDLREAAGAAGEATEGTYLLLFGEGGFVSPREVTYRPMMDPGQILGSIAGFYEAFAFKPRVEDPLDHIAVEAGFIGYFWLKEASALAAGTAAKPDRENAEITRTARERFFESHPAHIIQPLAERIMETGIEYLAATCRFLVGAQK